MKRATVLLLSIISMCLFGCSNKQTYEAIQHSDKNDCQKRPPSQVEECLRQTNVSYDEYERNRQDILTKKQ